MRLALLVRPAVVEVQVDALVQECQLAQAVGQNLVFVDRRVGEYLAVGLERHDRSAVRAFADDFDLRRGFSLAVRLAENLAVAVDFGDEQRRERVHARDAHAVQTSRDLVAALVELASGVQHRQHDFERRLALLLVEVRRDTPAVVLDGDRVVLVDRHVYIGAVSGQRLVDRVVHDLVDEVVETLLADVADIHGRAFAHRFEALEDLDVRRGIRLFLFLNVFLFGTHRCRLNIVQIYGFFPDCATRGRGSAPLPAAGRRVPIPAPLRGSLRGSCPARREWRGRGSSL